MTHTCHRRGTEENLKNDFAVLAMACRGINDKGSEPKLKRIFELFKKHNAINLGEGRTGSIYTPGAKERLENLEAVKDGSIIHAVFTNIEDVKALMEDLKKEDLGISVVVSGIFEDVWRAAQEIGIYPHSVDLSLETWGKTEKLPEYDVLEITTMCGHAMVSPELVEKLTEDVRKGKLTPKEAGEKMAACCVCGIFNPERAAKLIELRAKSKKE